MRIAAQYERNMHINTYRDFSVTEFWQILLIKMDLNVEL